MPSLARRVCLFNHAHVCRYDVKYGSQGFNHLGYQGGCEFVGGTYAQALKAPLAARYLCSPEQEEQVECLFDHSGNGRCWAWDTWDGFARVEPVCPLCSAALALLYTLHMSCQSSSWSQPLLRCNSCGPLGCVAMQCELLPIGSAQPVINSGPMNLSLQTFLEPRLDCQGRDQPPGQRCLKKARLTQCVNMACSADGQVLVEGKPCDPGASLLLEDLLPHVQCWLGVRVWHII